MNLDIVVKFASGKLRSSVITISQIVALIVLLIIFHGGMIATFENLTWLSPALEIPYGYVYSIIPFASLLMAGQNTYSADLQSNPGEEVLIAEEIS